MWDEQTDVSDNTDKRNYAVVLLEFSKTQTGLNSLLEAIWDLQYGGLVIKSLKKLMLGLPDAVWFGVSKEEANEIQMKLDKGGIKAVVIRTYAQQKLEEMCIDKGSEESGYDVILADSGGKTIDVLKVIRAIMGIGLMDKDLINLSHDIKNNIPQLIKTGVSLEDALAIKKQFEDAGATVEIWKSLEDIGATVEIWKSL